MADTKLTDLSENTTPSLDDWLYLVDDEAGSPASYLSQKVQVRNLSPLLGGFVLLEQHTASGSASLDFTTAITSDYDEYLIEFLNVVPVTSGVTPRLRVSTDGGSTWATTNYSYEVFAWRAAATASAGGTSQAAIIMSLSPVINTSTWGLTGSVKLYSPGSTSSFKQAAGRISFLESVASLRITQEFHGTYESTTAVNAFQFLFSSGNIASGTIRVYGLSK